MGNSCSVQTHPIQFAIIFTDNEDHVMQSIIIKKETEGSIRIHTKDRSCHILSGIITNVYDLIIKYYFPSTFTKAHITSCYSQNHLQFREWQFNEAGSLKEEVYRQLQLINATISVHNVWAGAV